MIKAFVPQSEKCMPVEHYIPCVSGHRKKYFVAEDTSLFWQESPIHKARREKVPG